MVAVRQFPRLRACALLALNPHDEAVTERIPLQEAVGQREAVCSCWSPSGEEPVGPVSELVPELPPHSAQLYFLTEDGVLPEGLTLGGSGQ